MKEYIINSDSAEQRIDRFLVKLFPNAGKGFLQKMLRKKNILVNHHKSEPNTILALNDTVQVYFSDETISKFSNNTVPLCGNTPLIFQSVFSQPIYEDQDILVVNKPAGLLSQPGNDNAQSLADYAKVYLSNHSETFHLAPANRLDRNTSGIVLIPKNYPTQKKLLESIRERNIIKEYLALVQGTIIHQNTLTDYLKKNENNTVYRTDHDGVIAKLEYYPIASHHDTTLLLIRLHTGRTHQIRVQLSAENHPIIGDNKYGNKRINLHFREKYQLSHQLLHSFHYAIPSLNYDFKAPLPDNFKNILKELSFTEEELNGILA